MSQKKNKKKNTLLEAQKDLAKYDNNLNTVSQQIPVTNIPQKVFLLVLL